MKFNLLFICLVFSHITMCQRFAAGTLWVGDAQNNMHIDSDAIRVECVYEFKGTKNISVQAYKYAITGDTLRVFEHITQTNPNRDFLITHATADELTLLSLHANALPLAFVDGTAKTLHFKAQQKIFTDTIAFQKIVFKSTTCYGVCPPMTLQIDSNKHLLFSGITHLIQEGFYIGTLSDEVYKELQHLLGIADLDHVKNPNRFNVDLPTYTLEIHYNNKVVFIKSSFLSYTTRALAQYLLQVADRTTLTKAASKPILFFTDN